MPEIAKIGTLWLIYAVIYLYLFYGIDAFRLFLFTILYGVDISNGTACLESKCCSLSKYDHLPTVFPQRQLEVEGKLQQKEANKTEIYKTLLNS